MNSSSIRENLIQSIGNTPLIRLRRASEETGCTILGKAEFMNPGGSVKDRAAKAIVLDAEKQGVLKPGGLIVEGTAGNTGIGLALVGNSRGYRTLIVIPETQSQEKKDMLRLSGAELKEVPAVPYRDPQNYIKISGRLAEELNQNDPNGAIWANQFDNVANRQAHYETTGPEIWEQTEGRVTHFIATLGTSGTLVGTGRRLKAFDPAVRVIAIEPPEFHGIEGLKNMDVSIVPGIYDDSVWDEKIQIETEASYEMARRLTRELGVMVGQSCGAAMAGALQVAERNPEATIVTIFPDSGEKYMSTPLWQ